MKKNLHKKVKTTMQGSSESQNFLTMGINIVYRDQYQHWPIEYNCSDCGSIYLFKKN